MLPSVEVSGEPPVAVPVDVSALAVPTELPLALTVTALPPLELWPSLLVVIAPELLPPAEAFSEVELLDTCPPPFELAVSVVCSPGGLPPLQAHARTHANGLYRTQLMRVNLSLHFARRKQALIERAEHIPSSIRENHDHCTPTTGVFPRERVFKVDQRLDGPLCSVFVGRLRRS